jgi:hypothetical protein
MGDDFNFFLPDELLDDDSDDGDPLASLPPGFVPKTDFTDAGQGGFNPAQSRLLSNIASATQGSSGLAANRWVGADAQRRSIAAPLSARLSGLIGPPEIRFFGAHPGECPRSSGFQLLTARAMLAVRSWDPAKVGSTTPPS